MCNQSQGYYGSNKTLSPVAQAVLDAGNCSRSMIHRLNIASALRAAADQVEQKWQGLGHEACQEIRAIAAELEAQTEPQISEEENERRFREALRIIQNTTSEELTELMGEEFLEEFRRVSRR